MMEHNGDFIMVRGSARIKRKNLFYVVPECGPCTSRIFHWSSSERYSLGHLLEVTLKDGRVYSGKFNDGIILGDVFFTCDKGFRGKYVTQAHVETFSIPITEEELVKIHIKDHTRESAATTKQRIKRDYKALVGEPSNWEKSWRSRLEDFKKLITGKVIELHLQNRYVYSGRLQDGIILEEASLIGQEGTPAMGTVAFPASVIALIKNKEHNSNPDECVSASAREGPCDVPDVEGIVNGDVQMDRYDLPAGEEGPYDVPAVEDIVEEYFSAEEDPYDDVQMEILPTPIFSYGTDSFQLYGFPHPKLGEVIGLVGGKHTGKTTALNILAGKLVPNLCMPEESQPGAKEFRSYLDRIRANDLEVSMKTQLVSREDLTEMQQQKPFVKRVREILEHHCGRNPYKVLEMCQMVGIDDEILTSLPSNLTNAGIQKVKIAAALLKEADAYLLDDPSRFLNRKDILRVAHAIVSVIGPNRYVVVADEDVKMVEYISKCIFILDGTPNHLGHIRPFPYHRP